MRTVLVSKTIPSVGTICAERPPVRDRFWPSYLSLLLRRTASRARRSGTGMNTVLSVLTDVNDLEVLIPQWQELFVESGTRNPFAHPLWLTTWARHFVPADSLYLVTARNVAGKLVGIAPLYRSRRALAPGLSVTRLRLLGTGPHAFLT